MFKIIILSVLVSVTLSETYNCARRTMQYGDVCVCNSSYCDTVPPILKLSSGQYQLYTTSKANVGFFSSADEFSNNTSSSEYTVTVADLNTQHQTIIGFGGAFTGTASWNILSLSERLQDYLLESYFGNDGIRYTVNRVPMGAADFSLKRYTNCDKKDESLETWALQDEDKWRIEAITKASQKRGKNELKLFISSWTSPSWMKSSNELNGTGYLLPQYYNTWAKYYVKFLKAYRENNVEFWGVTTQNEAYTSPAENMNLKFSFRTMNDWILKDLGPTLRGSDFKDIKIIGLDDSTYLIPGYKAATFQNQSVMQYLDGVAIHWYTDSGNQESYWQNWPKNLFVLATEACQDVSRCLAENTVRLGDWSRAVNYINSIYYDLSHNFAGWVEWNLALNTNGGPNWINCSLDAPIIVDSAKNEFYKQPTFYIIGHFSKFVVPGSVRLSSTMSTAAVSKGIKSAAFLTPDHKVVVVLSNVGEGQVPVNLKIQNTSHRLDLEANSINTLIYKP